MAFDYSVAIKLTVANLASQGLRLLAGDLFVASKAADNLKGKLAALKLVGLGYGMEKIGSGILGFLEKSVDASKEYTRQLSLMNAAGMTQKDIAESTASAWKTSRDVITSTAADNLKSIRELRTVLGSDRMSDVYKVLPDVQRIKGVLEAVTGREQEGVAYDLIKAVDLRTHGLITTEAVTRNADLMGRTVMAMGGTISISDMNMALKQMKTGALSYNDEFIYDYLPTLIQEVKTKGGTGSTAGTALATLTQLMTGGTALKKSAVPLWEESGLLDPSKIVKNATGMFQMRPGAIKDVSEIYEQDPLKWFEKHGSQIQALADKLGVTLLDVVNGMFQNRNSQWLAYTFIEKAAQFERDRKTIEAAQSSYGAYQSLLQTNPQLAEMALHNQWQNIQATIGFKILPRLIPYMIKFADTLDNVSQWMQAHPDLTKGLIFGLGGVAIAFSVIGKVLMTAGVIKFLGIGPLIARALVPLGLVGGVIALIGVAAYEAWKHWDVIGPKLKAAWDAIRTGVSGLLDWIQQKWEWLTNLMHPKPHSGATGQWGGGATGSWDTPVSPSVSDHNAALNKALAVTMVRPTINVTVKNKLDRNGLTTIVTQEQAKAFAAPQTGLMSFDGTLAASPAGGGF